jgi:hypothetical protein
LVSIQARVDDVKKLGDRWRAELVIGSERVVVVGQPGAGIPVTTLVEGRTASVVGIVRRAYPSATDRRPTILPRGSGDIHVADGAAGTTVSGARATASGGSAVTAAGDGAGSPSATDAAAEAAALAALRAVPAADLSELADRVGERVRVGGLVRELRPDGFTLDDGTAVGTIRLTGAATDWLPLVEPDDAINVAGRVEIGDDGPLVVVDDPAAIVLGADPVAPGPAASAGPSSAPSGPPASEDPGRQLAGLGLDPGSLPGAGAGVASLALIAAASVAVSVLRRRHARRLLAGRIATRLAALAGDRSERPAGTGPEAARSPVP